MGVRSKEPLHHPLPWGPPLPAAVHSRLSPPQQAQPRQDGEVTPTLDMALFDWTDYEDLKPEVWPSAEKKGTPHHLCQGSPPSLCHPLLGQKVAQ